MLPVSRLGDLKFLTNVDDASLKVLIKASLQYIDSGVRDESTAPGKTSNVLCRRRV